MNGHPVRGIVPDVEFGDFLGQNVVFTTHNHDSEGKGQTSKCLILENLFISITCPVGYNQEELSLESKLRIEADGNQATHLFSIPKFPPPHIYA